MPWFGLPSVVAAFRGHTHWLLYMGDSHIRVALILIGNVFVVENKIPKLHSYNIWCLALLFMVIWEMYFLYILYFKCVSLKLISKQHPYSF